MPQPAPANSAPAIRFDRNELAGAFGDMGTDVPLLIGVALASHLDGTSVLIMFGAMQILTGLAYRMPMPVPPLKLKQGGELLLCTPCIKQRQVGAEMLIEGAKTIAAARVVAECLEAKATLNY